MMLRHGIAMSGPSATAISASLIHASWLNQIELYFSIIQRKVLTPNDLDSLTDLIERIRAFGERYSALGKPFSWTFTRQDLERRLHDPLLHLESAPSLHTAA
jgi:hypothetical protein